MRLFGKYWQQNINQKLVGVKNLTLYINIFYVKISKSFITFFVRVLGNSLFWKAVISYHSKVFNEGIKEANS